MLFICISVMTCYLLSYFCVFCFFKQKTAYEMRISDWSSDVCSSDLLEHAAGRLTAIEINSTYYSSQKPESFAKWAAATPEGFVFTAKASRYSTNRRVLAEAGPSVEKRSEEHTSELQSLMRISYAVFCLKKKKNK